MSAFDAEAYEQLREGAERSAAACLPIILGGGTPHAVLDVGAGSGCWARELERLLPRAVVLALDENESSDVQAWTVEQALPKTPSGQRWPLVLCLELAEHLTPKQGDRLVSELCRVAGHIAWSAAVPGQRGLRHVNEQWPSYWAARFARHGFGLSDPWRAELWDDPYVEPWYAQNLLLAKRGAAPTPRSLVHPTIWQWRLDDAAYWREIALQAQRDLEEVNG